jgi:histone H1/5
VAELAARAHEISLEAGSKMASALKDVINAAAGVTNFAVESARDLVQYMVRRGQMTQDEADKLIREAEEATKKRGGGKPALVPRTDGAKRPVAAVPPVVARAPVAPEPKAVPAKTAPAKAAAKTKPTPKKPVAKKAAAKPAKKPKKG